MNEVDPTHPPSQVVKKRLTLISWALYAVFIAIILSQAFNDEAEVVPLLNLRQAYHIIVFTIAWPIIGSLLALFVVPRIFVPLYLTIKRKVTHRDYVDSRIELERPISFKLVLTRGLHVFLLVMGLEAVLIPVLNLNLFLLPSQITGGENELPLALRPYNPQVFIVTAGLIFPIAMMLWVIVWAIQDSGLIHYNLAQDSVKYQEIEPVYFKLAGYVKGFSGISSIFFYFAAIYHIAQAGLTYWADLLWVASVSLIVIIWSAPFIMLYLSINYGWVGKDVTKMARIQMEDLKFE